MWSGGSWGGQQWRQVELLATLPLTLAGQTTLGRLKSVHVNQVERTLAEKFGRISIFKGIMRKNIKITKQSIRNKRMWWKCFFSFIQFPRELLHCRYPVWMPEVKIVTISVFLPLLHWRVSCCLRRAKTLPWPLWLLPLSVPKSWSSRALWSVMSKY